MASRDVLTELERWYLDQCDEEWEHDYGVAIDTLDNPGWRVRVDVVGTDLAEREYARLETHRSETDWVVTWRDVTRWHAACGGANLGEALDRFLSWAGPRAEE